MKFSKSCFLLTTACSFFLFLGVCSTLNASGPGNPEDQTDFNTHHFSSASTCSPCHDGIVDETGRDVSLVDDWSTTLMAFSFVDPLWQAKVASERNRLPQLDSVIQKKCVRCHGPMASVEALATGEQVFLFDGGFTDPDHPLHAVAKEGVSCTLCHQVKDTPELGTDEGGSGSFSIGDFSEPRKREIYGQFDDVFAQSMIGSVRFTPVYGEHIHQSKMCATCHELKTDYVDQFGDVVSTSLTRFPEQMPYSEWEESDFGPGGDRFTSCQSCHFVQANAVPMAHSPRWLPVREQFSTHTIPTENTIILGILERHSDELGISSEGIAEAIDAAADYLAAAGSVEVLNPEISEEGLEFQVRVSNLIGHKLPTGIPIRRAFLHTTVRSQSGDVVFESGRLNPDHSIEGVDADGDPSTYESHWETITESTQVQVYEGIMGTYEGDPTYTLLRASQFLKDNRLLPPGFDKEGAAPDVLPAGNCVEDEDFTGGSDIVSYKIEGLDSGPYAVEVELLDQTMSYPFIADLLTDAGDPVVDRFAAMYAATPAETGLIDVASAVVH